ncbi:MAG: post-transcriptional regulator [Solobacterium sp.]|nr:post-transcriptional regulator [Solobacterium sp.]
MESAAFDVNNTFVQLTMVLKLQQLQRSELPSLRYDILEDYVAQELWKNDTPYSLHQAADDILSVTASQIVRYLSRQAVIDGAKMNLEDFKDVIGGD